MNYYFRCSKEFAIMSNLDEMGYLVYKLFHARRGRLIEGMLMAFPADEISDVMNDVQEFGSSLLVFPGAKPKSWRLGIVLNEEDQTYLIDFSSMDLEWSYMDKDTLCMVFAEIDCQQGKTDLFWGGGAQHEKDDRRGF